MTTATIQDELERIAGQRQGLADRLAVCKLRLAELPRLEDEARREALKNGQASWDALQPLREERRELEAEIESLEQDDFSLSLLVPPLERQAVELEAEKLVDEAAVIEARQRERLTSILPAVEKLRPLFEGMAPDEAELATIRAKITELIGPHSKARPVVDPLPVDFTAFLHMLSWVAGTDDARGNKWRVHGGRPKASAAWLDAVPDWRSAANTPLAVVDGVQPHVFRRNQSVARPRAAETQEGE